MTDNEIKKAKEDEIIYNALKTLDPFDVSDVIAQMRETINRQQAEIEKLEHQLETLCIALKLAKAEAYKEFVERLIICLQGDIRYDNKILFECDIDNLVKEMVGE